MTEANLLTDLPELYEERFPDPEHRAARWAENVLARYGCGPRLLDVGCGTGRDAAWLHHRAGRRVTGIDTSHTMLAHARSRHPGPAYHLADMREFDLDASFDAVVCLDSALLYCHTNDDLSAFLARCRAHLTPGGLLVAEMRGGAFFLGSTELLDGPRTATATWRGVTYTSRTTLYVDHSAQLLRRRRIWTADDGAPPAEQHSAWRLLFPQELRYFLTTAGFEVLALYDRPGPRTEPPWTEGEAPSRTASSDRLHLIARLTPHHRNGDSAS
ncbi:class I SAM-dependent methyltransferase [Streptomyces sp. H34-S4]|uniref:class I SAM-dependent methyltransferase n=1 Tax=Streptomyces sp. H34-S4 TaxID=2996463 RepID=UPI0022701546|nr:class I SAM-dependent methyltransferase [Streptomyces sp. H34-S4]MCY0934973.1 methyltransferase domain-containing protein [Streptomyces sp. H34-S4]